MNKSASVIHESQSVALENPVQTSQAVLPYYVDDTKKTKYLSFRATGFAPAEARELADVTKRSVERWRADDKDFRRYDTVDIAELRQTHGAAYHSAEFQRNLRAFMELDRKIIARAHAVLNDNMELSAMDVAEQGYLKTIRPLYSAANLSAMIKAASGGGDGTASLDFTTMVQEMGKIRTTIKTARAVVNGQVVHSEQSFESVGSEERQES